MNPTPAVVQPANLSAYAEWAPLCHHDDDTREEWVLVQTAGRGRSAVAGVVKYRNGPRRVTLRQNGLGLDPRIARALLLRVWEQFAIREEVRIASGMQWVISDLQPLLHRSFNCRDVDLIIRQIRTFSPNPLSPPDVLNVIID